MKVLITGAAGFLGRTVVRAASSAGHDVRALVRTPGAAFDAPVEVMRADLRWQEGLGEALQGIEVVIHLAAAKAGGSAAHLTDSVAGTTNLLAAMERADVGRLVHISSFSVYDTQRIRQGAVLDEACPLIDPTTLKDDYSQAKRMQEELVRRYSKANDVDLVVLRPGIIYAAGNLWNAHLGSPLGDRWWLAIGSGATVPLAHVENVADAVVLAITAPMAANTTSNILDDGLPNQRQYRRAVARVLSDPPKVIPLPWRAVEFCSKAFTVADRMCLGRLPDPVGLLREAVVHARFKPMRYSNAQAKSVLTWEPRITLPEVLLRAAEDGSRGASARAARSEDVGSSSPAGRR